MVRQQMDNGTGSFEPKANVSVASKVDLTTIVCHNCLKKGHYSKKCPEPVCTCSYCNRLGHRSEVCRERLSKAQDETTKGSGSRNKGKAYKAKMSMAKPEPSPTVLRASLPSSALALYGSDSDSDVYDNYNPMYPRAYSSSFTLPNMTLTETSSDDLFLLDGGANVHIVSSLSMLEDMIRVSGSTARTIRMHANPKPSDGVKGINPKDRLPPTHRHHIRTFGQVLVIPGIDQHIISNNALRRLGVTTISDGETDTTSLSFKGHILNIPTYPDGLDYFTTAQALHLVGLLSQSQRVDSDWKAYPASKSGSMHWAAVGGTQKPYYVSTEQQPRVQLFQELHYMYCHPSDTSFKAALSHGSILGTPLVPADVDLARLVLGPCPQCLAGKSINPSYTSSPTMPAGRIGSRVFMDLVPLAGTTIGGNNHVLLYLDAYSGYLGVCGVDSKRSQSVINALDVIVSAFEVGSHRIEEIVTDSEICFVAIRPHLMSVIRSRHLLTPPKQHNQRIERYVRVINDRMRSVLAGLTYVLPTKLYGELMATVVFFMNMFPNKAPYPDSCHSLHRRQDGL